MKKNYIYLSILIIVTVILTLGISYYYKKEIVEFSYAYKNLNKISAQEFEEYMIEHPDTIIYMSVKTDLNNNKFEKKLVNELEKFNLLENIIYIEYEEIIILCDLLKEKYNYDYQKNVLPAILVISDGETLDIVSINKDSKASNIINYEVFK